MTTPTAPPDLDAPPDFPALSDRTAGTYNSKAFVWATSMTDTFAPQLIALAANLYANSVVAYNAAGTATTKAEEAADSATAAAAWATSLTAVEGGYFGARYYALQAAQAVASLPSGTINDTTPSGTNTFSSNKINTLLADKQAKITANGLLKGDGSGGVAAAVAGTDYQAPLVFSGTGQTVKTINGQSLSGAGDITISGGLTLIAALNATAVSALDFLNVFTSTYDDYIVEVKGLRPSASNYLALRVANAGAVDTSSNYFYINGYTGSTTATSSLVYLTGLSQSTDAFGSTGVIRLRNVNSSDQIRFIDSHVVNRDNGASNIRASATATGYIAAGAISGFRLFWDAGSTFQAQGNVRVYGVPK